MAVLAFALSVLPVFGAVDYARAAGPNGAGTPAAPNSSSNNNPGWANNTPGGNPSLNQPTSHGGTPSGDKGKDKDVGGGNNRPSGATNPPPSGGPGSGSGDPGSGPGSGGPGGGSGGPGSGPGSGGPGGGSSGPGGGSGGPGSGPGSGDPGSGVGVSSGTTGSGSGASNTGAGTGGSGSAGTTGSVGIAASSSGSIPGASGVPQAAQPGLAGKSNLPLSLPPTTQPPHGRAALPRTGAGGMADAAGELRALGWDWATSSASGDSQGTAAGAPIRLRIPALGVNADVEQADLASDGSMEAPKRWQDVAWFDQGYVPGEFGSAVLAGHLDSDIAPAVFWNLHKLQLGDQITVERSDGLSLTFAVVDKATYALDQAPLDRIFGASSSPMLNLVTCTGTFDWSRHEYLDRLIVFTALQSVSGGLDNGVA